MTHSNPVMAMNRALLALRMSKVTRTLQMYIVPVDFRNPQFPLLALYSFTWCHQKISYWNKPWIQYNILQELLYIWSDWKSLNGLNFLEDIDIKFRELSWQKCRNCLACEFIISMARITDFCCKTTYRNLSKFFCFRSIIRCFQCFVRCSSPFEKLVFHEPPLLLGNYCLWTPPPPHLGISNDLLWQGYGWIFSRTTHSSKNPHKRQHQVKKTISYQRTFTIISISNWPPTGQEQVVHVHAYCVIFHHIGCGMRRIQKKKCKSNKKSSSHPSLELAPVQVFSHPQSGLTRKGCCFNTERLEVILGTISFQKATWYFWARITGFIMLY